MGMPSWTATSIHLSKNSCWRFRLKLILSPGWLPGAPGAEKARFNLRRPKLPAHLPAILAFGHGWKNCLRDAFQHPSPHATPATKLTNVGNRLREALAPPLRHASLQKEPDTICKTVQ